MVTVLSLLMALATATPEEPAVPARGEATSEAELGAEASRKTLREAFAAALAGDFQRYLALVHPSEKASPAQVEKLERFTFSRFIRQAGWYLKGDDAASFVIERTEELGSGKLKVYLKVLAHPSRPAMPVTLQEGEGGALILSNSL